VSQSYVSLVVHIVFSTKERIPFISAEHRDRLYEYMGGIVRKERGALIEIGGMPDHVHLLARLRASVSLSEMIRLIKGRSSHWMNERPEVVNRFGWQNGYGAFSVSESQVPTVRRYIRTQEEHHAHRTYRDEIIALLRKHQIPFDEKTILD
jgi:REP element-mobilizing transposase RayT